MSKILNSQSGFGFLEVLGASAALLIALMAMMSFATATSSNLAYDQNRVLATEIATSVLEDLFNRNSTDPVLTNPQPQSELFDQSEHVVAAGGFFNATWVVTPSTPIANTMKINLSVSWSTNGSTKSVNFVTFRNSL